MKKTLCVAVAALTLAVAAWAIGTESEIRSALGLSVLDMTRLKRAVGQHQKLGRDATTEEAASEIKSRVNELVRREEAKAGGDTLGQWGGI